MYAEAWLMGKGYVQVSNSFNRAVVNISHRHKQWRGLCTQPLRRATESETLSRNHLCSVSLQKRKEQLKLLKLSLSVNVMWYLIIYHRDPPYLPLPIPPSHTHICVENTEALGSWFPAATALAVAPFVE